MDSQILVAGRNVVAAEVHQEDAASADLRFELAVSSNVMPAVCDALTQNDAPARRVAVELLHDLGPIDSSTIRELHGILEEGDVYMQACALMALMNRSQDQDPQVALPPPADDNQSRLRGSLALSIAHQGWTIAKTPGCSPQDYEEAMVAARVARILSRSVRDPDPDATLAMAAYRLQQYETALKLLSRDLFDIFGSSNASPARLACECMAQFKLGREDESRVTLEQLRKTLAKPEWLTDQDGFDLLQESQSLIESAEAH